MRPPGGYKNISYVIMPVKSYMTGFQMFTAYGAVTSIGLYIYYLNAKMIQGEYIKNSFGSKCHIFCFNSRTRP